MCNCINLVETTDLEGTNRVPHPRSSLLEAGSSQDLCRDPASIEISAESEGTFAR